MNGAQSRRPQPRQRKMKLAFLWSTKRVRASDVPNGETTKRLKMEDSN